MNLEDLLTVENLQHELLHITDLELEAYKAKIEFAAELTKAEIALYRLQAEIYQARIDYEYRKLTTTETKPNQTGNRTQ